LTALAEPAPDDVADEPAEAYVMPHAGLLQREAVAPQRDRGERGQTELVINGRSIRAFGQLRHRIAHLVAQHLPDALDFRTMAAKHGLSRAALVRMLVIENLPD
jgi:hypothetical protein